MRDVAPRTTSISGEASRCRPGHEPQSTAMAWALRPNCALAWSISSRSRSTSGLSWRSCMSEIDNCCSFARACRARTAPFSAVFADWSARERAAAAALANISTTFSRFAPYAVVASSASSGPGTDAAPCGVSTSAASRTSTRCRTSSSRERRAASELVRRRRRRVLIRLWRTSSTAAGAAVARHQNTASGMCCVIGSSGRGGQGVRPGRERDTRKWPAPTIHRIRGGGPSAALVRPGPTHVRHGRWNA